MLLTKMSSAIQQKFNLPIPEQNLVTNFFDNLHDLMNVIKFPQDLVVGEMDHYIQHSYETFLSF